MNEEYLETGERTREIEMFHWVETLEVFKMSRKYNNVQLAEKIMNGDTTGVHNYMAMERLPQKENKQKLLNRMKTILKEPKRINTKTHGRIYF